ncbi:hypothetical protein [Acetobacter pasteurianus]|uniref:Uncharacterized protein n=1 Tax=Acetobacter pasteurianus subsp. pasteurianus TaxID=481145 RepID=A0A1Y0Y5Y9_ACEPA|nr:hypothetical protein [Acetobacter pasteurianus]ARW47854.1 hypothetical protein S1001342_01528 [Acetobacter pasteurianus subsp. pasteurianus]
MRVIRFELPEPYPLLNHSIGQSRFALTRMRQKMARAVACATVNMRVPEPFQKAHVSIERHSCGTPDHDGVQGGAKFLIDTLTTPKLLNVRKPGARQRVRNKRGLGFIVDDGPEYATFDIRAVKSRLCDQKTVVTITEILP